MISYQQALETVLNSLKEYGTDTVPIKETAGRILAGNVVADRDFPPFDKAAKDGVVLNYQAIENGRTAFEIVKVISAGSPASVLEDQESCMEIMTGAVLPYDADTVVMYEDLEIENGIARLKSTPKKGQNILYRGSNTKKGEVLLSAGTRINAAGIGILAAVGNTLVSVKKLPRVAVISTGNELQDIEVIPESHQIRSSNSYFLSASLREDSIDPMMLHLPDDKDIIRQKLSYLVDEFDVLLLSGRISRGQFDYLPEVLHNLGVQRSFHGVLQRPGKPFWFGQHPEKNTLVFSFPGNPTAAFTNYHVFFRPWLNMCLGLANPDDTVVLAKDLTLSPEFTHFIPVILQCKKGALEAGPLLPKGPGDLASLAKADGLVKLSAKEGGYTRGEVVPFIPIRSMHQ